MTNKELQALLAQLPPDLDIFIAIGRMGEASKWKTPVIAEHFICGTGCDHVVLKVKDARIG